MSESGTHTLTTQAVKKALTVVCLLVGIVGVTASKAMTVLLALGGLASFFYYLTNKGRGFQAPKFFTITLVLLFIWALISSFWSLNENGAFMLCLRLGGLCLAGFFFLNISKSFVLENAVTLQTNLLIGCGFGLIALSTGYVFAILKGTSLWGHYYFDPLTTLNNGAVIISLLLIPCVQIIWQRYGPRTAITIYVGVCGEFWFLSSGASLLSICVGAFVFTLIYFIGKKAGLIIAVTGILLILAAPLVANHITQLPITQNFAKIAPASAKHRLLMWEFVSNKIAQSTYLGLGMDSSRHIPQDEFRLAPNMEIMPLHPHDSALQIRLELGVPGVILSAILVLSLFFGALKSKYSRGQMALRTSVLCSYLAVGAVSYGVWQSWWIATAWLVAVLVRIAAPTTSPEVRNPD